MSAQLVDKNLKDVTPINGMYVDEREGEGKGTQYPRQIRDRWSDVELLDLGWFRLNYVPIPDGHKRIKGVTREWRDGVAWETCNSEPIPATREHVNFERARLFSLGARVDLGDGLVVPVDTRNQGDITNIQGLTSFGMLKMMQQETGTFTFGGADDVEYQLTYPQLIEIGLTAMAQRDAIWKASRAVKAQIKAGTLTKAADIPAAFDAILGA